MPKKKTHEQYVKEVEALNNGIKVIETYINNSTKILHECIFGHQWKVTPNKILIGRGCPFCNGKKVCKDNCLATLNPKLASEWHPTKNGDLTPYDVTCGSNKKVWWMCENHHEWIVSPNNRLNGTGCPKCCKYGAINKTHEEFVIEVENIYGIDIYEFLTKYIDAGHKIKVRHKKCGYVWLINPYQLLRKRHKSEPCPYCNQCIPYTTESFKEKIYSLVGNEYSVLGEYINDVTKIKIRHNICGNEWNAVPNSFISGGTRCPACNESKGEKRVRKYLLENNYIFEPQQDFDKLIGLGGGKLLFDFYLPSLNLLIEYQGEFHDGTARQQSVNDFLIQQEHDKRKRQYANDNSIRLLEIWYWDFDNIEKILEKELY